MVQTCYISERISDAEVASWEPGRPVIISAGTGAGKSYFIKNNLYKTCKLRGQKLLMLIHRVNPRDQFQMEIERDGKQRVIDIMTYQKVQTDALYGRCEVDLSQYAYIVCDEFHYFIGDAGYNEATDVALQQIFSAEYAVKILMSATGDDVSDYIQRLVNLDMRVYDFGRDTSFIGSLSFYYSDDCLEPMAKAVLESGSKAIFFIESAEKAYVFYKKFKAHAVYNCSKSNKKFYKYVDSEKIKDILRNRRFEESLLVTTSCFAEGVDIIDRDVRYIFTDLKDIGSMIQSIGRKRMQPDEDPIDIYIKGITNRALGGILTNTKKQLEMADYLMAHTTDEYLAHYPRKTDVSQIVYDARVRSDSPDYATKKVNVLKYRKKRLDIGVIREMLSLGEFGYCKYVCKLLDRYDEESGSYLYSVIRDDFSLEQYLGERVGKPFLRRSDRKELIETMDVRSNGKLLKSLNSINSALEERGLPFRIQEYETSASVEGSVKKFKHAWRIVRLEVR